ncbi:MAG: fatty acid desaturase family protein [Pseudomonadota bacterium]
MGEAVKISDVLHRDELRALSKCSNRRAALVLSGNWLLIVIAFAGAIIWPNPLTILLGIALLGGRQLGLEIIMHDCAHNAFFVNKALNQFVGHWICGAPRNIPLAVYRDIHLKHHKYAGSSDDPDLKFVKSYPVTAESLKRKFIRDLTGQTGLRDTLFKLRNLNFSESYQWIAFHAILLLVLTFFGAPWAYLMWWAAEIFIHPAISRLRQIGEHGVASNRSSADPRDNTSTTRAAWWERLFVSPNFVNYHLEHHYFAHVPGYNLQRLHKILSERGFYDGFECVSKGYADVLMRSIRTERPLAGQSA